MTLDSLLSTVPNKGTHDMAAKDSIHFHWCLELPNHNAYRLR
jgi:hypothetical protein